MTLIIGDVCCNIVQQINMIWLVFIFLYNVSTMLNVNNACDVFLGRPWIVLNPEIIIVFITACH